MRWILAFPLFAYLLIAANVVMFSGSPENPILDMTLFELALPSGKPVIITVANAFILSSFFVLYIEVFKATRASIASQIDHALSLMVFVFALVQFLTVPELGNMTFLVIMLAALMDVVIGFTVTIATAKRDMNLV